jgi:16S rRNA (guanine966-N2)-methyltransferase
VKESIFNILRGWFDDAVVLDLFSGVGTMGLEAMSRGARAAVLVERDRDVIDCLEENIRALHLEGKAVAVQADALSPAALADLPGPVTVAFMDPPYPLAEQASIRGVMAERGWLLVRLPYELAPEERPLPGFDGPEIRSFGDMHVHLWSVKATHP